MNVDYRRFLFVLTLSAVVTVNYLSHKYNLNYKNRIYHVNKKYSKPTFKTGVLERTNLSSETSVSQIVGIQILRQQNIGHISNVIVQYGKGRTSTTLQFEILCLMMVMLHEEDANSVGCYFNRKPSHKYTVIKTHSMGFLLKLPQNASIFMTARSKRSIQYALDQLEKRNRTVHYIAYTDMVTRRGHYIAYEYQSIFGISNKQMSQVVTHLRYWDILRRCCGKQMSSDWRNHLSPRPKYSLHHDPNNVTYPACEMHNISEVERLFIETHIYKMFTSIDSLRNVLGKPSTVDGTLNGHYCEQCNKNIAKRHLQRLNDNCE